MIQGLNSLPMATDVEGIVFSLGSERGGGDGEVRASTAGLIESFQDQLSALVLQINAALAADTARLKAVWLITFGAQAALRTADEVRLDQAPALGLWRSLRQEYPHLWVGSVDLNANNGGQASTCAGIVLCERDEAELALVDSQIFVPRLRRAPALHSSPKLRPLGLYLVCGGVSGLGLLMAEHLVALGAREVVLVGRQRPKQSAEKRIQEMREHGATIHLRNLDVSDAAEINSLIEELSRSSHLAGIVHCAGTIADGIVEHLTWPHLKQALMPKAVGTWNLHQAMLAHGVHLDFFILFSSSTSLLGDAGQGSHAAACAFLDEFASFRAAQGLTCSSVHWGAWSESGYFVEHPDQIRTLHEDSSNSISNLEGLSAFETILATLPTRIAVLPNDWRGFKLARKLESSRYLSELESVSTVVRTREGEQSDVPVMIASASDTDRVALLDKHLL
ncbi:MAG: SDR family NAD(P)-dependent oxidoreductase, partial [Alphaproteobacteria bacterium]|nr:SDR family NAD(P)-dependent oxidoreductase [Alphaproteobacteria bacterium]